MKISDLKICLSMDGFTHYAQPQIQSLEVITLHVTPTQDGTCDGLSVAGLRGCNLICAFGSVKNMKSFFDVKTVLQSCSMTRCNETGCHGGYGDSFIRVSINSTCSFISVFTLPFNFTFTLRCEKNIPKNIVHSPP